MVFQKKKKKNAHIINSLIKKYLHDTLCVICTVDILKADIANKIITKNFI